MTPSRPAKLVFLTQYVHPEIIAIGQIITDIAVGMASRGAEVRMVAAQPAPGTPGEIGAQPRRERYQGVEIMRIRHPRWNRRSLVGRFVNFSATAVQALLHLLRNPPGDLLFVDSSSPLIPLIGWLLWRLRGQRYAFLIADVYPDIAISLGYMDPGGPASRLWRWAYRHVCRRADRIIVLGDYMKRRVRESLVDPAAEDRIHVIHTWVDGEKIVPKAKQENPFSRQHGLVEPFVALYSGNLGRGHDLETILAAAEQLKGDPSLLFLFIGDGAQKRDLQTRASAAGLANVRFLPYQPTEALPWSLTCGDVSIVSIRNGVEGLLVPTKLYAALAAGRPILAVTPPESEVAEIVATYDCGLRVDPGDAAGVVRAMKTLSGDRALMARMKENARKAFESRFTRDEGIRHYHRVLVERGEVAPARIS